MREVILTKDGSIVELTIGATGNNWIVDALGNMGYCPLEELENAPISEEEYEKAYEQDATLYCADDEYLVWAQEYLDAIELANEYIDELDEDNARDFRDRWDSYCEDGGNIDGNEQEVFDGWLDEMGLEREIYSDGSWTICEKEAEE